MIATISTSLLHIQPIPRLHNSRTNWTSYRTKLHDEINLHISLKSCTEVEEATNNFISLLQEAAQQATPTIVYKKDAVNIPLEIKKLLAQKRKERAQWQRSHIPSDKTAFNRLSSNLKSKLKAMRAHSFTNYISTVSRYDNSVWKPIKFSRKPILASRLLRLETPTPERWAKSDKEKVAVFAIHLADVFQQHEQETDEEMLAFQESPAQSVEPIKLVTPKEVKEEIGLLSKKKASGLDLITPKMLKELPPKGTILLILRHQYWPHKLKLAEIILIPKPGKDPKEVKSNRRINLLPVIAKLFEKMILHSIDLDFSTSDWIPHHQFGFRRAHSKIQQCHRITHTILKPLIGSVTRDYYIKLNNTCQHSFSY